MAAAIITPARLGLGLADVERHHRLAAADGHLLREAVEPRFAAGARGVAPELGPERRVGEQPLQQPGREV